MQKNKKKKNLNIDLILVKIYLKMYHRLKNRKENITSGR